MDDATKAVLATNYTKFRQMVLQLSKRVSLCPPSQKRHEDDVNRIASTVLSIGQSEPKADDEIRICFVKHRQADIENIPFYFTYPPNTRPQ